MRILREGDCLSAAKCYLCNKNEKAMTETMDRDATLKRFQMARQRKRDCIARLEKSMKEEYEKRTGKTADYFFAL